MILRCLMEKDLSLHHQSARVSVCVCDISQKKSYFKDNNISKHVVISFRAHTFVRFHPLLSTNLLKFIGDQSV